jgi:hypothetical protein
MSRLTQTRDEQVLNDDDQAAIAFLESGLMAETTARREALVNKTASSARVFDQTERSGPGVLAISPMCHAAAWIMAVSVMKAQAEGRFSAQAHWWGDVLAGFDMVEPGGKWHLFSGNLPAAVSAGIRVEAIEAVRDGRLDELTADERQYVDFFRRHIAGTMTDECWAAQVALIGSERGVVELAYFYLYLFNVVRMGQLLALPGDTDAAGLQEILDGYRNGDWPKTDIAGYESTFRDSPWPQCMDVVVR